MEMLFKFTKVMAVVVFVLIIFSIFGRVFAEGKILINEFLIEPQPQQVEIFNTTGEDFDLSGWIIDDNGGSSGVYPIPAGTVLPPNSCLIFSKDFNLNKSSSDAIRLYDTENNLIDSFSYKSSSGSGISFFRMPDGGENWSTGAATMGLLNSDSTSCIFQPSATPTPVSLPQPSPTDFITPDTVPTAIPVSIEKVYLSEAFVNTDSNEKEWVEIYNDNEFPVTLSDWWLDDLENGGSAPKKIYLEIPAKGYKAHIFTTSIYNNDGDSVRLVDDNGEMRDSFEYINSRQGESIGRIFFDEGDFCDQVPSYEAVNNPCLTREISSEVAQTSTIVKTPETVTPKSVYKSTAPNNNINYLTPNQLVYRNKGQVLGVSDGQKNQTRRLFLSLNIISFFYSLLTLGAVLFKMTFIYGESFKFPPPSFRTAREQ